MRSYMQEAQTLECKTRSENLISTEDDGKFAQCAVAGNSLSISLHALGGGWVALM